MNDVSVVFLLLCPAAECTPVLSNHGLTFYAPKSHIIWSLHKRACFSSMQKGNT